MHYLFKGISLMPLCLVAGCAVFKTYDLPDHSLRVSGQGPKLKSLAIKFEAESASDLKTILFSVKEHDVRAIENSGRCRIWEEGPAFLLRAACETSRSLSQSNEFGQVSLVDISAKPKSDLTIELKYKIIDAPSGLQRAWSWINVLTVTLIPYRGEIFYELDVVVKDKNDIELKKYEFKDRLVAWRSIVLLPVTPFVNGYGKTSLYIFQNMVGNLLVQMRKDGLI